MDVGFLIPSSGTQGSSKRSDDLSLSGIGDPEQV
jgi:hypothetical protein